MFANVSHGLEATLVHGLVELRLPAEETWGDLGRFDYQGLGVHDVVINNVTCDTFRMQAFHCQYRTSRNAVVLGFVIEVNGSVSGTAPRDALNRAWP